MYTGMRSRSAKARAQPMWSACSCVMKMASSWSASMPARPRRLCNSRTPRPQSTSRWVTRVASRAWTTVALPLLPLPRLLKRIVTRGLLQVLLQQRDDLLRHRRRVGCAARVEHRDRGLCFTLRLQGDAVLDRVGGFVVAEDLREEAAALAVGARVD